MENEQNGNTFFTTTVIVLDQISLVQNPKSKFCTRIFKYKNNNKYRLINLCTHFVVPLNERVRRKVGNVDLELVLRFPRLFYFIVLIVWSLVQNPKSKFCTRIFKYKNNNKYRLINLCTHFVVPLNERVRRKVGNVDLELVSRFPRLFYFIMLILLSEYLFCCSIKWFLYSELNT